MVIWGKEKSGHLGKQVVVFSGKKRNVHLGKRLVLIWGNERNGKDRGPLKREKVTLEFDFLPSDI